MPNLPTELEGKTPEEIAAWYQNRETQLTTEFNTRLAETQRQPPPPAQSKPPGAAEFWSDPVTMTKNMAVEQFNQMMQPMQQTLIVAARMAAKDKFKDFDKFAQQIDQTMRLQPPFQQAQPAMWETVYYHIKGTNADRLVAEAVTEGRRMGAEPVQPATPPDPNAPRKLTGTEAEVAAGFGIDAATWDKAKKRVEGGESWPMAATR